ncbi:DUF2844 domain-containing protein [Rhodoferax sp. GW822-FHT02A01]|uniref:DUF2844 domain-containing protein n=1 Tax=Rhodoferax sp. GW822-FHT02A01 TaxID=3141537 RepID=UPI00315CD2A7
MHTYRGFARVRLATTALLLMSGSSWAALGGNLASVQSDQQAFAATNAQTSLAGGTLYTQTLPNSLIIRQYVDAAGNVYAVAWEGPVLPDFQRLLGASYPSYQQAVLQQQRGVRLQTPSLVIESGGMMRSFMGRAFLPAQLPAALSAQSIH